MVLAAAREDPALALDRPPGWCDSDACDRLATLAERLSRTVAVARGLTAANRQVDLAGFEDGVGLLCAKTLDLDFTESRRLLPALLELRAQIDGLSATIAGTRDPPAAARTHAPTSRRREAH